MEGVLKLAMKREACISSSAPATNDPPGVSPHVLSRKPTINVIFKGKMHACLEGRIWQLVGQHTRGTQASGCVFRRKKAVLHRQPAQLQGHLPARSTGPVGVQMGPQRPHPHVLPFCSWLCTMMLLGANGNAVGERALGMLVSVIHSIVTMS